MVVCEASVVLHVYPGDIIEWLRDLVCGYVVKPISFLWSMVYK